MCMMAGDFLRVHRDFEKQPPVIQARASYVAGSPVYVTFGYICVLQSASY